MSGYRTHGEYIYDYLHRPEPPPGAVCVRRTPPGGLSDARAAEILAAAHPDNAAMVSAGRAPARWYTNKCFSVMYLGCCGDLPYGVLYRHDTKWLWFRANAAWVRSLTSLGIKRCKVREDFPEVFEETRP